MPGRGEYFAKVYLLRPKIRCNSRHSRPKGLAQGKRTKRGNAHQDKVCFLIEVGGWSGFPTLSNRLVDEYAS